MTKQEAKRISNNIIDLRSNLSELENSDHENLLVGDVINTLNALLERVYKLNAETEA